MVVNAATHAGAVYKDLQGAQNLARHPKAEREMTTSQPVSPTVERLREDQITAAAGVLARAFQNDPPLAYGIPNPAQRAHAPNVHEAVCDLRKLVRRGLRHRRQT